MTNDIAARIESARMAHESTLDYYSKIKPAKGQKTMEEHWITLRGGDQGGGTHVQVDKAGNITAGPAALAEKGIKSLSDFGKSHEATTPPKRQQETGLSALSHTQLDKMSVEGSKNERYLAATERANRRGEKTVNEEPKENAIRKDAHQMTKAEWSKDADEKTNEGHQGSIAECSQQLANLRSGRAAQDWGENQKWGNNGEHKASREAELQSMIQEKQAAMKNGRDRSNDEMFHRHHLDKAIAAGKTIPPEVLADYPDLVKKPEGDASSIGSKLEAELQKNLGSSPSSMSADYRRAFLKGYDDKAKASGIEKGLDGWKFSQKPEAEKKMANYGDKVRTKDGQIGTMRGSGGMGSGRVGVEDADGHRSWHNREDLEPVSEPEAEQHNPTKQETSEFETHGEYTPRKGPWHGGEKYFVRMNADGGNSESIHSTAAEANAEAKRNHDRDEGRRQFAEKESAQKAALQAARDAKLKEYSSLHREGDTALMKGKRMAALEKQIRIGGKADTLKNHIDRLVGEGRKVESMDEFDEKAYDKAVQDVERMARTVPFGNQNHPETVRYNDLKNKVKNRDFTKKIRGLVSGDNWLTEKSIGKLAMDYAEQLQGQKDQK